MGVGHEGTQYQRSNLTKVVSALLAREDAGTNAFVLELLLMSFSDFYTFNLVVLRISSDLLVQSCGE